MSQLVRMILDTYETLSAKPGSVRSGGIMNQLLASVRTFEQRKASGDAVMHTVIDEETDALIRRLREYEEKGDLGWMEASSIRVLPKRVKVAFERHVKPLNWSGYYFQFQRFMDVQPFVFADQGFPGYVYDVPDRGSRRVVVRLP